MLEKSGLKIASWNINSVRKRLPLLARLADESEADVICLQETKANVAHFPAEAIAAMGFEHQAVAGFGGYNGVAVLSKRPLTEVNRYPHCDRNDARHISAVIDGIAIHSLYIPAGGDLACAERNPKFAHKLKFVDAVADHFAGNHGYRDAMVLAGDFNVAPLPSDVWDHVKLSRIVTHTPIEIAALERLKRSLQFIDTLREVVPEHDPVFTWWSYRASDWQAANKGRRLDHIWVTQPLKTCIKAVEVLTDIRHWTPPSDHVPVILTLHNLESAAAPSHAREPSGSFS